VSVNRNERGERCLKEKKIIHATIAIITMKKVDFVVLTKVA
jgi:hypothetical protein